MTLLGVLERKGFVVHITEDRTYIFSAAIKANDARKTAISTMLLNFFGGSVPALMSSLVDGEIATPNDLEEMRRIIRAASSREPKA